MIEKDVVDELDENENDDDVTCNDNDEKRQKLLMLSEKLIGLLKVCQITDH